jgi:hypothetical protein
MAKKRSSARKKPPEVAPTAAPSFSVPVYDATALEKEWNDRMAEKENVRRRKQAMLETTMAVPEDRMTRYRRNPRCPACDAHPTVCIQRRGAWAAFRCRHCGHRFEVY